MCSEAYSVKWIDWLSMSSCFVFPCEYEHMLQLPDDDDDDCICVKTHNTLVSQTSHGETLCFRVG